MFHKSLIACLFAARAVAVLQLAEKGFSQQARPVSAPPIPAILLNYQLVTAERLKNPEANNWLMIRRTYDGCANLRQVDWRRRGNPFAEASAPGGSRNGSTEMRS